MYYICTLYVYYMYTIMRLLGMITVFVKSFYNYTMNGLKNWKLKCRKKHSSLFLFCILHKALHLSCHRDSFASLIVVNTPEETTSQECSGAQFKLAVF